MSLAGDELRRRAQRIKLVVTDNDGVLTDTGVYYSERGEEMKRYSVRDGMGVELLHNVGIATAIVTREETGSVHSRAAKLRVSRVYAGIRDKRAHLEVILHDSSVTADEVAYIGDDVNDLEIMREVGTAGLTAAPVDAMPRVKDVAQYRCTIAGGYGAFREFADFILDLRQPAGR